MLIKFKDFLFEKSVSYEERINILRDEKYIVVAPLSEEASCKYGAFTHWCTANIHSGAWDLGIGQENINTENNNKLVYIIRRNYTLPDERKKQTEEYYYLRKKVENQDFDENDNQEELNDRYYELEHDSDSLDFSKIAIEYNFKSKQYGIWSANNICISDNPWYYDLYDIPVEAYVIDKIKEFCKK